MSYRDSRITKGTAVRVIEEEDAHNFATILAKSLSEEWKLLGPPQAISGRGFTINHVAYLQKDMGEHLLDAARRADS